MFTNKSYKNIPASIEQFNNCSEGFRKYVIAKIEQSLKNNEFFLERDKKRYFDLYNKIKLMNEKEFKTVCNLNSDDTCKTCDFYFMNTKDPEQLEYLKALYDQAIFTLDENLKDLLSLVKSSELKDNTILIITADHGEAFMEHGTLSHDNLYDEVIKTPLIMYIPGIKNKRYQLITQSVDIVPTILNLVGIKNNYKFSGKDIFSFNPSGKKTYSIAEDLDQKAKTATIRDLDWKLFVKLDKNKHIPYELYNIKSDPQEKENVLLKNTKEADKLTSELKKILGQ